MNSTVQKFNSLVAMPANSVKNAMNFANARNSGSSGSSGSWNTPLVWFSGFMVIFIAIFAVYYREAMNSMDYITAQMNAWLTGNGVTPPQVEPEPTIQVAPPKAPQDDFSEKHNSMVDRILPPGKEIFTVSKNDYTYYDAAPLCKALGAELATYDQVKEAWQKGADWCNYGWVKGQMAVYPTQDSTYQELQQGPEEQKGACGKPGLNGGFFDNPELKFGVTCSGKRPKQSQHDATALMSSSDVPLTASGLEFEKKVQHFKEDTETLGILPFNKARWSS